MTDPVRSAAGQAVAERGPLCVGIDPHPGLLDAWGQPRTAAGLERCARGMVEALGAQVAVFKPQSAFFEPYGSAGIAVLERTLADIAAAGALSLLDVKRGDIGSSMDAYAAAYLADGAPLAADAITVSPYLGFGSLAGAIELALQYGRGVYVLALTSNPEGPQFQHARVADGRIVGQVVVEEAARRNPAGQLGSVGRGGRRHHRADRCRLLAGSTAPSWRRVWGPRAGRPRTWPRCSAQPPPWCCPTTSREVMAAGPDPAALRSIAARIRGEMKAVLGLG